MLAIAGCGGSDAGPTDAESPAAGEGETATERGVTARGRAAPLTPAELRLLERTQEAVHAYCRHVLDRITQGGAPRPRRYAEATSALDELAALAQRRAGAETPEGVTPRLALGDIAEDLQGTNCDRRLVAHIRVALNRLPHD